MTTVPPSPAQGETAGVSEERLAELVGRVAVDYVTDSGKVNRRELAAICGELLAARQQLAELESNKRALEGVYAVAVKSQTELSQQLAEMRGRWIPWKSGDPLPIHSPSIGNGTYRIAFHMPSGDIAERDSWPGDFAEWEAIAYWSLPLPPNYAAALAPTSQPSRGKCDSCGGKGYYYLEDGVTGRGPDDREPTRERCADCAQPERQGAGKK